MEYALRSLFENHAFDWMKLPMGKRALKNRWVNKLKMEDHSSH